MGMMNRKGFSTKFNEVGVAYVFLPGSDWGGYYNVEFAHP